jgi:hypothetical protein
MPLEAYLGQNSEPLSLDERQLYEARRRRAFFATNFATTFSSSLVHGLSALARGHVLAADERGSGNVVVRCSQRRLQVLPGCSHGYGPCIQTIRRGCTLPRLKVHKLTWLPVKVSVVDGFLISRSAS